MGCDIHVVVEIQSADGTWQDVGCPERLKDRTYDRFAFLTGGVVRNYSNVPAVLPEPRGYPADWEARHVPAPASPIGFMYDEANYPSCGGDHSASWLTLEELWEVDYGQKLVDFRIVPGPPITLREFLGENWFDILNELTIMTPYGQNARLRIVFDFDS